MKKFTFLIFIFYLFFNVMAEYDNSKFFSPYIIEGSDTVVIETAEFSEYNIPEEFSENLKEISKNKVISGNIYRGFFEKKEITSKDVYKTISTKLKELGFSLLLDRTPETLSGNLTRKIYEANPWRYDRNYGYSIPFTNGESNKFYYLTAVKEENNEKTYLTLNTISGWNNFPVYRIDIIKENSNTEEIVNAKSENNIVGIIKGSNQSKEEFSKFSKYTLVKDNNLKDKKFTNIENMEGKLCKMFYYKENISTSGIYNAYLKHFNENGYKIIYKNNDLNDKFQRYIYETNPWSNDRNYGDSYPFLNGSSRSQKYILASKENGNNKIYIVIYAVSGAGNDSAYRIDILQTEAEIPDIITANAIDKSILEKGRFELYGILFKTGSYNIIDVSDATLKILADYINSKPNKEFYLVGHTDSKGSLDMNMTLSENRAKSVKNYIVEKFNVNQEKISCHGVGPLYPVSSNATEDGRKFNRRVEIVVK